MCFFSMGFRELSSLICPTQTHFSLLFCTAHKYLLLKLSWQNACLQYVSPGVQSPELHQVGTHQYLHQVRSQHTEVEARD